MAEQNNNQSLKEITNSIEQGIENLWKSDKHAEYLHTLIHFHNYSLNNTMLTAIQRPNATLVASFNKWRDQFFTQRQKRMNMVLKSLHLAHIKPSESKKSSSRHQSTNT